MEELIVLDNTIFPWIARTSKMVQLFLTRTFQESDLDITAKQWVLLKVLLQHDGNNQNDLAQITKRNKGSITRIIATLEDKNLVARLPDPNDNRINRIFVTKKGHQLFKNAQPAVLNAFDKLQSGINTEDIQHLINIHKRILNNISANS